MIPFLIGCAIVCDLAKDRTKVKRERGFFSSTTTIERRPGIFSPGSPSKTVHHRGFFSSHTTVSGVCYTCSGTGVFRTGSACRKCDGTGKYVRRHHH